MKRVFKYILLLMTLMSALTVQAQQDQKMLERLRDEEARRKAEIMRHLDSGVYFMDMGEYALADKKFLYALNNLRSIPSDLTFYFGKNSFYLGKFKQSIDWLNKYIQLKGTSGRFYDEAVKVMREAEAGLLKEKSEDARKAEETLSENYDIDCGPSGKISCPVCKGDHVIIRKGPFGNEYKTCPYCNEHGMLTCEEYNKLLRGELNPRQ